MSPREHAMRVGRAVAAAPSVWNAWLAELPTVQFQAFVSAVLACGTALAYWICVLREIAIDSVNFGIWLSFVAAYGGVTYYKAFKTKRETFQPTLASRQNALEPETTKDRPPAPSE